MLLKEARRRNLGSAEDVALISDGAKWLKEIARTHFSGAIWILDFYNASEHLHGLVNTIYDYDSKESRRTVKKWTRWLLKDNIDNLINKLDYWPPKNIVRI